MGTRTQIVRFHLTDSDFEQQYTVKKDGIIREIRLWTLDVGDVIIDAVIWRDQMQIFPEAGNPSAPDNDSNDPMFDVENHINIFTVWEPVRKRETLRFTATPGQSEEVICEITILPVDAMVTKIHTDSIEALGKVLARRIH